MAKTKRRNNKVKRTKSRKGGRAGWGRGGGPKVPNPDKFIPPFDRQGMNTYELTSANRGFTTNPNYRKSTFSLFPPVSSWWGVKKPKQKNMYEKLVSVRQKEIDRIRNKDTLTEADNQKITTLNQEIQEYKNENAKMLREAAIRSNYKPLRLANQAVYSIKRLVWGPEGRYSSDSSGSDSDSD